MLPSPLALKLLAKVPYRTPHQTAAQDPRQGRRHQAIKQLCGRNTGWRTASAEGRARDRQASAMAPKRPTVPPRIGEVEHTGDESPTAKRHPHPNPQGEVAVAAVLHTAGWRHDLQASLYT